MTKINVKLIESIFKDDAYEQVSVSDIKKILESNPQEPLETVTPLKSAIKKAGYSGSVTPEEENGMIFIRIQDNEEMKKFNKVLTTDQARLTLAGLGWAYNASGSPDKVMFIPIIETEPAMEPTKNPDKKIIKDVEKYVKKGGEDKEESEDKPKKFKAPGESTAKKVKNTLKLTKESEDLKKKAILEAYTGVQIVGWSNKIKHQIEDKEKKYEAAGNRIYAEKLRTFRHTWIDNEITGSVNVETIDILLATTRQLAADSWTLKGYFGRLASSLSEIKADLEQLPLGGLGDTEENGPSLRKPPSSGPSEFGPSSEPPGGGLGGPVEL